jgi:hypothetical protein
VVKGEVKRIVSEGCSDYQEAMNCTSLRTYVSIVIKKLKAVA